MTISAGLVLAPKPLRHSNISGKAVCSQELPLGKDTEAGVGLPHCPGLKQPSLMLLKGQ